MQPSFFFKLYHHFYYVYIFTISESLFISHLLFPLPTSPLTFSQCGDHLESSLGFLR